MKISELEEMLKNAREILGDVEVFLWDSDGNNINEKPISSVNYERDHIELTN